MVTNLDASQSLFIYTKNNQTGKISKIAIPADTQIGRPGTPANLDLFGRLVLAAISSTTPITYVKNENSLVTIDVSVGSLAEAILPSASPVGQIHIIKDGGGNAGTVPIKISATDAKIDGAAYEQITTAYDSRFVYWNGKQWSIIKNGSGGGGAPTTAQYLTLALDAGLSNERVLTGGTNITFTDNGPNGTLVIDAASGAPTTAQYVTLALDGGLSNERVLTAGTGVNVVDGGAGSTLTISSPTESLASTLVAGKTTGANAYTSGNDVVLSSGNSLVTAAGQNPTDTGVALNITAGNGNTSGEGGAVNVTAGIGGTTGGGGATTINGGAGGSSSGNGGAVTIQGGVPISGIGGAITITSGGGGLNTTGGAVIISGGAGGSNSGNAGAVTIQGGSAPFGNGGGVTITGRNNVVTNTSGGPIAINAGNGNTAGTVTITSGDGSGSGTPGGAMTLTAGAATSGNASGGAITITSGRATGSSTGGALNMTAGGGGAAGTGAGGQITISGGAGAAVSGAGGAVTLQGGSATNGNGGAVTVQGRNATGTSRTGGSLTLQAGTSTNAVTGGSLTVTAGTGGSTGTGGTLNIQAGLGGSSSGNGGTASIAAGDANNSGAGGTLTIRGGSGFGPGNNGGGLNVNAGEPGTTGTGGQLSMTAGSGGSTGIAGQASMMGGAGGTVSGNGGGALIAGGQSLQLGGPVTVRGGAGQTNGTGGLATIIGGDGSGTGGGGPIVIVAGSPGTSSIMSGSAMIITAGAAGSGSRGGDVTITAGRGGQNFGDSGAVFIRGGLTTLGRGGDITINASAGTGSAQSGGNLFLSGGNAVTTGIPGLIAMIAGSSGTGTITGGTVTISAGGGGTGGTGGSTIVSGGLGGTISGSGGVVTISGGVPTSGSGGGVIITGANAASGSFAGGSISLLAGFSTGTGSAGTVSISAGPGGSGSLGIDNTGGFVNISAGSAVSTNGSGGNIVLSPGSRSGTGSFGIVHVVSGALSASAGLSGSLQQVGPGLSYLVAGTNVTISSQSNGQIVISSTGGSGTDTDWSVANSSSIYTTSSVVIGLTSASNALGQDVFFYVSGTINTPTSASARISVFGGDVRISGTLTVGSSSVTITSNDINFGTPNIRIERTAAGNISFYDSFNTSGKTLTQLVNNNSASDVSASYVTIGNTGSLPNERALIAGTGLIMSDNGPGSTVSFTINDNVVATVSGTTFTGPVSASAGLSGSLQQIGPSLSYLVAGANITISSQSNGQVFISSTAVITGTFEGAADVSASYVTIGNTGSLPNERALIAGTGLVLTDNGPGSTVSFAINDNVVATVSGTTFIGPVSASAGLSGSLQQVGPGLSYLIAGANMTVTSQSNGQIVIASTATGGSGADVSASYVTIGNTGSLPNERMLTAGTGLVLTDGGANSTITFAINDNVVATVSGTTFTGVVSASAGLSGSLQQVGPGLSYLIAGANITITSQSNGQLIITSNTSSLWTTAYNLDFTTEATQSLKSGGNGSKTIDSNTWTWANDSTCVTASIISSTGLLMSSSTSASDYQNATRTAAVLNVPLTTLFPSFNVLRHAIRITARITTLTNMGAAARWATFGLEDATTPITQNIFMSRGFNTVSNQTMYGGTQSSSTTYNATSANSDELLQITWDPPGTFSQAADVFPATGMVELYSEVQTTVAALLMRKAAQPKIFFSWRNSGSQAAFSFVIKSLKVEYYNKIPL